MASASPETRRRLGRIFVGLGLMLLAAAALFGAGIVPLPPPGGLIVAAVLALAGVVMATFGVTLLAGARS
jgi:hypothetical protein